MSGCVAEEDQACCDWWSQKCFELTICNPSQAIDHLFISDVLKGIPQTGELRTSSVKSFQRGCGAVLGFVPSCRDKMRSQSALESFSTKESRLQFTSRE